MGRAGIAGIVALSTVVLVASAFGAPRAGEVPDPRDTAPDLNGTIYPDTKSVSASYDPDSGAIEVAVELYEPLTANGTSSREVSLELALGGVAADGRSCAGPGTDPSTGILQGRTGDVRVSGQVRLYQNPANDYSYGYLRAVGFTGSHPGSVSANPQLTRFTWTFAGNPALVRRDITCATDIKVNAYVGGYDEVAPFFFAGFAPPAVADVAPPVVSWQSPVSGQPISGVWQEAAVSGRQACRIGASDDVGVIRVDVFLDGEFLNQELYAPWACVLDTRTISNGPHTLRAVAYDAAGRTGSAQITVVVDNDPGAPPLPDPPAPPPPPAPAPLTPIVVTPLPAAPQPLAPAQQVTSTADVRAPRARVAATGRSLRNLVRGGLVVPVTCDETCAVRSRLLVAPRLARGLGISKIIGTSSAVSGLAGRRALTWIRLSPAAKRALRTRRALRATLSITLTDDSGNTRVQRRSVVLR